MNLRLREKIEEAVRRYNMYRSPEAVAEIIKEENGKVYIVFSGRFCHTCGVTDWIEDLAYEMRDLGLDARLVEVLELEGSDEDYRIGVFEVKSEEKS